MLSFIKEEIRRLLVGKHRHAYKIYFTTSVSEDELEERMPEEEE